MSAASACVYEVALFMFGLCDGWRRADLRRDGSAPMLLHMYGAYGIPLEVSSPEQGSKGRRSGIPRQRVQERRGVAF
jgi:hypothetical protein